MIWRDLARLPPRVLRYMFRSFFDIDVTADSCFYLGMRRL